MKVLTLTQPWATAIALGIKKVETRSWFTNYRGPLYIHAAKGFPLYARQFAMIEQPTIGSNLPLGRIVAKAYLREVVPTETVEVSASERLWGDYAPSRWAWLLSEIEPVLPPIPAKGALGLWEYVVASQPLGQQIGMTMERVADFSRENTQMENDSVARIKPFTYKDTLTGNKIAVTVSPWFSVIRVNDRFYYFVRETGEFDGASTLMNRE